MIADFNIFGLFIDLALVTALVAAGALLVVRRILVAAGVYRWVWHPPLVDLSLFALLWLAFALAAVHFQDPLAHLLG